MRNVLVVLVPLCFGLTSGFIVPRGIQEIRADYKETVNSNISARKTRKTLPTKYTFENISDKPSFDENTSNTNILDKEIFENIAKKLSYVKERSYIHIKQKAKRPVINRNYDAIKTPPANSVNHKSYLLNLNHVFEELPRQFSIGYMGQVMLTNTESKEKDLHCHQRNLKQSRSKKLSRTKSILNEREHLLKSPSINNEVKHNNKKNRTSDTFNTFYPNPTNNKRKDGYENIRHDDRYLLDQLVKQKLDEKGSLFVCQDCGLPQKPRLSSRVHRDVTCKCKINMTPRGVRSKHGP